jgi:hypothetical protein
MVGVAAAFPEDLVFPLFAVVLGLAAGVYPGFAMAAEGGHPGLQWTVAVGFAGLAVAGLGASPLILAVAWALHALWNFLHRVTLLGDEVPEGYPGFCMTFDLVMAGFTAYMWLMI